MMKQVSLASTAAGEDVTKTVQNHCPWMHDARALKRSYFSGLKVVLCSNMGYNRGSRTSQRFLCSI